jgi:hypothetical protein
MNPRHLLLDTSHFGTDVTPVVSLNDNSIADVPDSDPPGTLVLRLFGLRSPTIVIANEAVAK